MKFPSKNTTDELVEEIQYCQDLIDVIEKEEALLQYPKVKEQLNLLKETVAVKIAFSSAIKTSSFFIDGPILGPIIFLDDGQEQDLSTIPTVVPSIVQVTILKN